MKLSIEVPDDWAVLLRKAASDAGYRSVSEYVRSLLSSTLNVEHQAKSWGGARQTSQPADAPPNANAVSRKTRFVVSSDHGSDSKGVLLGGEFVDDEAAELRYENLDE